jgi:hypothetical protein
MPGMRADHLAGASIKELLAFSGWHETHHAESPGKALAEEG